MGRDIVFAPWTVEQVKSLNGFQKSGVWHEFTCGNNHAMDDTLVATEAGWVCPNCDYTQDWAHDFMANRAWEETVKAIRKFRDEHNHSNETSSGGDGV